MNRYYLGAFPQPYGGVTRKNALLFQELGQHMEIRAVDFSRIKRGNLLETARLLRALADPRGQYVIGVSGRKTRRRLCRLLAGLRPGAVSRSVLMLMGSLAADDIASDSAFRNAVGRFRRVYAETEGMCAVMERAGLSNTALYPNPRQLGHPASYRASAEPLRCVFFTQISAEKGADIVLQAAKALPEIEFHFYGTVEKTFEREFQRLLQTCANVRYHGDFRGTPNEVLRELGAHDVLLLPTRCAEGVPGVLVEGKIAGLAEVVSPFRYSRDVVTHMQDGWILEQCSPENLVTALRTLDADRDLLERLRQGSLQSAERFDLGRCVIPVLEDLK